MSKVLKQQLQRTQDRTAHAAFASQLTSHQHVHQQAQPQQPASAAESTLKQKDTMVSCVHRHGVAAMLLTACLLLHPAAVASGPAAGAIDSSGHQRSLMVRRMRAAAHGDRPRWRRSAAARRHKHSRRQLAAFNTVAAGAPVIAAASSADRRLTDQPAAAPATEIGA